MCACPVSACTPGWPAPCWTRRRGGGRAAAEVVALLSEEPPREYGDDLAAALRTARRGGDAYAARWRTEVRRLRTASAPASSAEVAGVGGGSRPAATERAAAACRGRVGGRGRRRARLSRAGRAGRQGGSYLMVSGTRAEVGEASGLRGAPWIAVAVADRPVGAGHARVRLGAAIDEEIAREAAGPCTARARRSAGRTGTSSPGGWSGWGPWSWRCGRCGTPTPGLVREALLEGLREEGLGLLRWSPGRRAAAAAARVPACTGSARPGPTCPTTPCTRAWTSGWSPS